MFYIYICLYKNLSYLIKTIPPPFLLPQRSRILGLDTISGSSGFLAPLTLGGLGPNTMRGNSALLSTMPCRDRPAIEQRLSQFPHAPQILRDEGKLCPPSRPWVLRVHSTLQPLGSPHHLRRPKMDFLPGFLSPTLRPMRSRAFSSSCCCMFRSHFVSSFPRTSDPVAGFSLSFSLITWATRAFRLSLLTAMAKSSHVHVLLWYSRQGSTKLRSPQSTLFFSPL